MASIPLPALHIDTQQQSPLAMYAQLQQIRNAQAQQQTQQLQQVGLQQENQQRALALQDQQTLRSLAPDHVVKDSSGNVKGFDTEGYFNDALGKQVNPNTINTMRAAYATTTKDLAAASETVRNNEMAKNKAAYELLEGMRSEPDVTKRAAILQNGLPNLQKLGVDTSKIAQTQLDDKSLEMRESEIGMHAQMLTDAKTQAETAKSAQETAASKATQAHTEMETAQGGSPEARELNAFLAKPENKGKDAADFVSWKAKQSPMAVVMGNMLPQGNALDQQAEMYSQTHELPQGFNRSPGTVAAIINRAAELHPNQSLASNQAEFKSSQASLQKLQTTFDQVSAFEGTALRNLDLYIQKASAIPDLGVKFANVPLRLITKDMIGEKNYAAMQAARQTAATETAKVLGSATASGVLSDSQKKEALDVLDGNLPLAATKEVVNTLKQDFANRHQSYQLQIGDIQKRIGNVGGGGGGSSNVQVQIPGHPPGTIPRSALAQFKKDHPDATVQE